MPIIEIVRKSAAAQPRVRLTIDNPTRVFVSVESFPNMTEANRVARQLADLMTEPPMFIEVIEKKDSHG